MSSQLTVNLQVRFADFALSVAHAFETTGITGLFGQSGSGKTTLLRAIAGLEPGVRGRVAMNGTPWLDSDAQVDIPVHRRGVGFVFQDARLFAHLNVLGNLDYAERRSRVAGDRPSRDDVVDALGLSALLQRGVGALSGGERQRVAIARALLARPKLLLFDEPLAALDVGRKGEILPYIERVTRHFGVGAIYVSHAMDEVAQLADHLLVLSAGQVAAHGTVSEVLERLDLGPMTGRFEAGVALTGEVTEQDPSYRLTTVRVGAHRFEVAGLGAEVGTRVRVRIRARDVALALSAPRDASIRNLLPGTVTQLIEEQKTAYAEVLVDIGGAHVRARITRRSVAELGLTRGTRVVAMVKSVALDRPLRVRDA